MPEFDNQLLMFAFRYALGRTSMAPCIVVDELKQRWSGLSDGMKTQVKSEIDNAISTGMAGHSCDEEKWLEILELC